jgi:hypothetical protein
MLLKFHCAAILSIAILAGACSVAPQPEGLGTREYFAYSCPQLSDEAKRLVRVIADRSEHLLADDASRRGMAFNQLSSVRRTMAEKNC